MSARAKTAVNASKTIYDDKTRSAERIVADRSSTGGETKAVAGRGEFASKTALLSPTAGRRQMSIFRRTRHDDVRCDCLTGRREELKRILQQRILNTPYAYCRTLYLSRAFGRDSEISNSPICSPEVSRGFTAG